MILTKVYPLLLLGALAAWSLTLPSALRRLRERLAAARPGTGGLLLLVLLGALALRVLQPGAYRVFDDEFEHLDAARHIASRGVYAVTVAGGLPGLDVYGAPTWPAGHHAGLAAWMTVAGESARAARLWSRLLGTLTVLLVFWAALELFGDERAALASAIAWAAMPLAVRYCTAVDLTSSSLFWSSCVLAGFAAELEWFAALSLAFAVNVRPENALLIGYAALAGKRRWPLIPALLGVGFPLFIAWSNRASGVAGYAASDFAPLSHLFAHAGPDVMFLLGAPLSLCLCLAALVRPLRSWRLLALAAALFAVYASFYRGDFGVGSEDRYALFVLLPLTVAAAGALESAALPAALLFAGLYFVSPKPAEPLEHQRAFETLRSFHDDALVVGFNPSKLREATRLPAANVYFTLEDLDGLLKLSGATSVAVWKDWGWRTRPEVGARLEERLAKRFTGRTVLKDGDDELVLYSR